MAFSLKKKAPFRLRLLAALLTAAAAGAWMGYASLMAALKPYSEKAGNDRLMSGVELTAGLIDTEIAADLEMVAREASSPLAAELLGRGKAGPGTRDAARLAARASELGALSLELADRSGRLAASSSGRRQAGPAASRSFRLGLKGAYAGPPLPGAPGVEYEAAAPVPPGRGDPSGPLGVLTARFRLRAGAGRAVEALLARGNRLALASPGGNEFVLLSQGAAPRTAGIKDQEAAPFLPALSGGGGGYSGKGWAYAWQPAPSPGWLLAAGDPAAGTYSGGTPLGSRARKRLLLWAALLAAGAILAAGALSLGLAEAGRQAADLLEQCGKPPADPRELAEPDKLAAAIAEVSAALRQQAARDLELETETEKLREEESDLKSQNDELEKLNKYLMERETRISELKQEISELREKVGGGPRP